MNHPPLPHGVIARGVVTAPSSKSIVQRCLFLASLTEGTSVLEGVTPCDDVKVFIDALRTLGVTIRGNPPETLEIDGRFPSGPDGRREIDLGNNGTALRFLTALSTLRQGVTLIRGNPRRPVGPLVRTLQDLGAWIVAGGRGLETPLQIEGGSIRGGSVSLDASISSQFVSALLLLAPRLPEGIRLSMPSEPVSASYVELTGSVLRQVGIEAQHGREGDRQIYKVHGDKEVPAFRMTLEGDASAAAFPLVAAALTGGDVTVTGVGSGSAQGDVAIVNILQEMGIQASSGGDFLRAEGGEPVGRELSLRSHPDLVPPLAALAAFADGSSRFTGVGHLRHKESDRLAVLRRALEGIGCGVTVDEDSIRIDPRDPASYRGACLDPEGDHRMAMTFALLALRVPGIEITDPTCVQKSDPAFFDRWSTLFGEPENRTSESRA